MRRIGIVRLARSATVRLMLAVCTAGSAFLSGCNEPASGGGNLARYDYPVVLDARYGDSGYRIFSTGLDPKAYLGAFAVSDFQIDPQGRIVVVGTRTSSTREAWMLRLLPDGRPDPSCGNNGWFAFATGGPASPQKIALLPDGRYVVGGYLGLPSLWAVRPDCTIDTTFGQNGMAAFPSPTPTEVQDGVNALAVDPLGRPVATVASTMSGNLLVARFTSTGQVDLAFGGKGYVSISAPDGAAPRPGALLVRPDGRILVATSMIYSSQVGQWAGFVQLLDSGQLDGSFGLGGLVSIKPNLNYVAIPKSLMLLPDGTAIQAGLTQPGTLVGTVIGADAYWLKVNAGGRPDPAYGGTGVLIWTAGPDGRQASTNYVTGMLADSGGTFLSCQNWTNNTKQGTQIEAAMPQALVQKRSASTGALSADFAQGGTGWLPRQADLAASCVGLRRAPDGSTLALLDYGPAETAVGQAFAITRVAY